MDSYLSLIVALKEKKYKYKLELREKRRKCRTLEDVIRENTDNYEQAQKQEEKYLELIEMLENSEGTIKKCRKTFALYGVLAFLALLVVSLLFVGLMSVQLSWEIVFKAAKIITLPLAFLTALICIKSYEESVETIKKVKKRYTVEMLEEEVGKSRREKEKHSKRAQDTKKELKLGEESILELEEKIKQADEEIEMITARRNEALDLPRVEELLNQEFEANSELNLIRERFRSEK